MQTEKSLSAFDGVSYKPATLVAAKFTPGVCGCE